MVQSPFATTDPEPGCETSEATASCGVMVDWNGSALKMEPLVSFPVSTGNAASRPFFPSSAGFSAQP